MTSKVEDSLAGKMKQLYASQQAEWLDFSAAVKSLDAVISRKLSIADKEIVLTCNPARIRSSAAKIDSKSLTQRPCFLCSQNRPGQQEGIQILDSRYQVLVNPFPILPDHFTVVDNEHRSQQIIDALDDLMGILPALDSEQCLVFNGAKAGASAPDHRHFQIVPSGKLVLSELIFSGSQVKKEVNLKDFIGAAYFTVAGIEPIRTLELLRAVLTRLQSSQDLDLINLLAWNVDGNFQILVFPRKQHRPNCYTVEGEQGFLLSPACIELAGLWVFPRLQDFERITVSDCERVISEVCFNLEELRRILPEFA